MQILHNGISHCSIFSCCLSFLGTAYNSIWACSFSVCPFVRLSALLHFVNADVLMPFVRLLPYMIGWLIMCSWLYYSAILIRQCLYLYGTLVFSFSFSKVILCERDFSKVFGLIALIFDRMIEHGVCLIILPRHFDSTIFVGVMIL